MTTPKKQSTALAPIDDLRGNLAKMQPQFKAALPAHNSVEKFSRVLMTAVQQTPALVQADRALLFAACMRVAQDGLLADGKEVAIVTFKRKDGMIQAQWMPMTAGILKKVRNSGELSSISALVVYT